MNIISASRRTDIPAFFSTWFMERVREGFFYRVNPFNTNQVKRFSLAPEEVNAIVFWSKNPAPLIPHLDELDSRGHRYYFQFTLNPYGAPLEPHLPRLDERIDTFRNLAGKVGPRRIVWRYDPVILSSATPVAWHLEQIDRLASALAGSTDRLIFSFLDFYGKVNSRLKSLEKNTGIQLFDITTDSRREELQAFISGLKDIGQTHGMRLFSCAEREDFSAAGILRGSCIDGTLIRELFAIDRPVSKDKNQRGECGCAASVDMGMYNTCSFRCAYCYANMSEGMIRANLAKHVPGSAAIINEYEEPVERIRVRQPCRLECQQPSLFGDR